MGKGDLPALVGMRELSRWPAMEIGLGNWIWRQGEQGDKWGKKLEEMIFLQIFFISDLKAFIKEFLKFTQNREELIEKSPNVHIPLLNLVFV